MGRRTVRSVSPSQKAKKKSKTSIAFNPFATVFGKVEEFQKDKSKTDRIFDEMLLFTELSKDYHSLDVTNEELQSKPKRLETTVRSLLTYMLDNRAPKSESTILANAFVSAKDVGRLLLPWSIRGILQAAHKASHSEIVFGPSCVIYWEALEGCLSFFCDSQSDTQSTSSSSQKSNDNNTLLTLSTMHKLLPIALKLSLNETEENSALRSMAKESYCRLTDNLYQPPFDVICDSLLPILASGANDPVSSEPSTSLSIWTSVATSTIRLMNARLGHANPKKSFQLLIRKNTFRDIATVYSTCTRASTSLDRSLEALLDHLMRTGIFSLEHHMDGFRSLQLSIPSLIFTPGQRQQVRNETGQTSKKPSFRGYQEGLFKTMEDFLEKDMHNNDEEENTSAIDVEVVSCISPFLLDVFLQQSSKLQGKLTGAKNYKKTKGKDKMLHLQFRFFACLTGYLVKAVITEERTTSTRKRLITMIGKNLELLLVHNIYQPSLGNSSERSFLESIGKLMVQSIITKGTSGSISLILEEWNKVLLVLEVLVRLDHTLLHNRLSELLSSCTKPQGSHSAGEAMMDPPLAVSSEASTFLITVVKTYGKLRQLDYFFQSLFDAVSDLARQNDGSRLSQLLALLSHTTISANIGRAVQESPIQQLKQMFSNMNNCIGNQTFQNDEHIRDDIAVMANSVCSKALIGLIQSVRVDSNSSGEFYSICKDVLNGSVQGLLSGIRKQNDNWINAVQLCAWLINLKNRCEFWVGTKNADSSPSDEGDIPPAILGVLDDAINGSGVVDIEQNQQLLGSLKFLACQRIQQLHRECYEKQRLAYASDASEYNTASQTLEARKLVSFILKRCDNKAGSTKTFGDQWVVMAESISIWAPYANEVDIDYFLNQLLHSIARIDKDADQKQDEPLVALLNDASFYEISNIADRLGVNIASFLAENTQKILGLCDRAPSRFATMACPILNRDWISLSFEEITKTCKSEALKSVDPMETVRIMEESTRVLETFNNLSIPIWEACTNSSRILQSLSGIESIYSVLEINHSSIDVKVRLVSALCGTTSRLLGRNQGDSTEPETDFNGSDYSVLLQSKLDTSASILENDISSSTLQSFLYSTTVLIEAIVTKCVNLGQEAVLMVISTLESFSNIDKMATKCSGFLVQITFVIVLLRKFNTTELGGEARRKLLRVIETSIWTPAENYCFNFSKSNNPFVCEQSVVFIAEILRFCERYSETQFTSGRSLNNEILNMLRGVLKNDPGHVDTKPLAYLVGCFVTTEFSKSIRQELAKTLLSASLQGHSSFLTPMCILVREMQQTEFDDFLGNLTSEVLETPASDLKMKIIHMIVLSTTGEDHVEVLAKHASMITNNCLQVITQIANGIDVRPDSITTVSLLLVDMASTKEVMTLRERDIALILGRITSTIRIQGGDPTINETQINCFHAMFTVLSFFLQRFSKQMHSCVPSLVISLTAMLQFTLNESLQDRELSLCAQKFSRLCELLLPHGEVYKKHVICLILRFVNSLQRDMNPTCKKNLLPGIYCLLDIIQEHESMQLNSMLDEECRALLRSVHEGYKRIHVYKGQ